MPPGFTQYFPMLALAACLHAHAADPQVVCVDAANPPFMSSVDGKAAGLYPALIASALQTAGVSAQLDARPWKRCIADIDAGTVGVGGIYKNDERSKKYDFSEQIFVEKMAVYFNKAHAIDFTGVDKLMGKRVGVVRGWSYGDEFDKAVKDGKITVDEVAADAQNFQKLAAGRVDAVLAIDEAGTAALKGGKFAGVEKSPRYLFENPTFLAFSKGAKQTDVLTKFNKAIADMKKNGQLNKIATTELSK
ncbi:MAG: transporter substrate-binding domain-containing protein [Pseudomonadota bacterium]